MPIVKQLVTTRRAAGRAAKPPVETAAGANPASGNRRRPRRLPPTRPRRKARRRYRRESASRHAPAAPADPASGESGRVVDAPDLPAGSGCWPGRVPGAGRLHRGCACAVLRPMHCRRRQPPADAAGCPPRHAAEHRLPRHTAAQVPAAQLPAAQVPETAELPQAETAGRGSHRDRSSGAGGPGAGGHRRCHRRWRKSSPWRELTFGDAINAPTLREKIEDGLWRRSIPWRVTHRARRATVTTLRGARLVRRSGQRSSTGTRTSAVPSKDWYVRIDGHAGSRLKRCCSG